MWVTRTRVLGPPPAVFPSALAGSWTGSAAAWTPVLWSGQLNRWATHSQYLRLCQPTGCPVATEDPHMGVATSQHNCPPRPGIHFIYYFHDTKYYPSFDFFPQLWKNWSTIFSSQAVYKNRAWADFSLWGQSLATSDLDIEIMSWGRLSAFHLWRKAFVSCVHSLIFTLTSQVGLSAFACIWLCRINYVPSIQCSLNMTPPVLGMYTRKGCIFIEQYE